MTQDCLSYSYSTIFLFLPQIYDIYSINAICERIYYDFILIFVIFSLFLYCSKQVMAEKERVVFHLEIGELHEYYGSMKRLADEHPKEEIGIQYPSLRNYFANDKNLVFANKFCIIRKGSLKCSEGNRGKYSRNNTLPGE